MSEEKTLGQANRDAVGAAEGPATEHGRAQETRYAIDRAIVESIRGIRRAGLSQRVSAGIHNALVEGIVAGLTEWEKGERG